MNLTPRTPSRWAALTGPAAAVSLLAGLFEDNVPTSATDSQIGDWLTASANAGWMIHASASALGGLLLIVFAQTLKEILAPEDDSLTARCLSAVGITCGALAITGSALFAAIPVGRLFEHSPQPSADTYRYLMAASASVLVIFIAIPAAALCATTAMLLLRRSPAPTWLGWASAALAVLLLASTLVAPLMVFGLWLTLTGTTLAVRTPHAVSAKSQNVQTQPA